MLSRRSRRLGSFSEKTRTKKWKPTFIAIAIANYDYGSVDSSLSIGPKLTIGLVVLFVCVFFFAFFSRNGSGNCGLFSHRMDFSSFNALPRHKLNSYHIKVSHS